MDVSSFVTQIMSVVTTFFSYVFDTAHPAIATVVWLPIIAGALGIVAKFAHHKHKT